MRTMPPSDDDNAVMVYGLFEDATVFQTADSEPYGVELLTVQLAARLSELLESSPAHVLSLLYRIDVDEYLVKSLFRDHSAAALATALAEAIIERHLRKLESRRLWSDRPMEN